MERDRDGTAAEPVDVKAGTLRGLGWSASSALLQQLLQFGFSIALARILVPHDFGLIASVYVFVGFASLFVDSGFGWAIVQRTTLTQRHLSSAFWLNVAIGTGMMILTVAFAPLLALFFDDSQLLPLTIALSPAFLIGSLAGVQGSVLQRSMNFRALAVVDTVGLVSANAVGVTMAIAGLGVWSLVGIALVGAIVRSALLWKAGGWRPSFEIDRTAIKELWSFGGHLTAFSAVNYWSANGDNLLIGRFLGLDQLAYYNRAFSLMRLAPDLVGSVTGRVMFPALSRLKDDREHVKRVYLRAVRLIAIAVFPAIVGLFAVAEPLILTLYGTKWQPIIPIFRILCAIALAQSVAQTASWIFSSQGRTDWLFRWGSFTAAVTIASFFVGLPWGTLGVATAASVWCVISLVPLFFVVRMMIDLSVADVVEALGAASIASAVMCGIVIGVEHGIPAGWGSGSQLAVGVAVGVVSYAVALRVVSRSAYVELVGLAREYTSRA